MDLAERHRRACAGFGETVRSAEGRWTRPSPCEGWDARTVVEHVIGFHDVLLLRPLGLKPNRPKDDELRRWAVTEEALTELLGRPDLLHGPLKIPAVGNNPASELDAAPLLAALTQDVLVHTWDLARAVGANDRLDPELCSYCVSRLPADADALVNSGMFSAPVPIPDDADPQSKLLARLGRNPEWQAQG